MDINWGLYYKLEQLRTYLKNKGKLRQARTPVICSDDALYEMARLKPQKLSDFECVQGIGKTFIDNYGEIFLAVIKQYIEPDKQSSVSINKSAEQTLKELEKKLVNINRRNRLLYLPRAVNKYAVDLFDEFGSYDPINVLFIKRAVKISDITTSQLSHDYDKQVKKFKKYVQLLREVNKDLRDKGQNDLYIGYPFVIGRLPGEEFDVRAPLALFPVVAEKTATTIKIQIDVSRDVLYNNTLILAYYKFNGITDPLPSDVIDDYSAASFIDKVLAFYKDKGLSITDEGDDLHRFEEYKSEEFPKFRSGELYLDNTIVIGKFPIRSSSIQKDFDEILERNEINVLLNDLLLGVNDIDYDSDAYFGEREVKINDKPLEVSEKELTYINELNSSQENVLSAVAKIDELVVQGPPGTGKSQTITSLIADAVSKNKSVLMVSEKKTALDVVYSRLGHLSSYALLIDDANNKELFYKQLAAIIDQSSITKEDVSSIETISNRADQLVKKLEVVAKELYAPDSFGIEPYKLYTESERIDLRNEREKNRYNFVSTKMDLYLYDLKYKDIESAYETFSDKDITSKIDRYLSIDDKYPWVGNMRGNLSEFDIVTLEQDLQRIKEAIDEWSAKNFIAKVFTKGAVSTPIKSVINEYFHNDSKELKKQFINGIDDVIESMSSYSTYYEYKPLFENLNASERHYLDTLIKILPECDNDYYSANDVLKNQLLNKRISEFEASHRELFQDIDNFSGIIRALSESIEKKQKLTRLKLRAILAAGTENMKYSKRYSEMLRVVESRRKWSVNKFVKKFDYELFNSIKIWLLTPEVVSDLLPLKEGLFDLVIFDEASQMYVEKGVPSIQRAKKVVIAGDSKQLRPSSLGAGRVDFDEDDLSEDEELPAALEEDSLLDLARFKYQPILLNFHYRSKYEELIAFSNYAFYGGRLYVSPNMSTPDKPPIEVHKLDDGLWVNRANRAEAVYVIGLLKDFFKNRRHNETIGVITFNANQRDMIEDLLDEECAKDTSFAVQIRSELERKDNGEDIGLFIKNIESVQGDERDVIIFSIGYAKNVNGRVVRNFGWLNQKGGENRLNVAISRAKEKVHIVTSIYPSELQVEDTKNEGPKILKKYLEYAFAVSDGDQEAAKQVLHSFADRDEDLGSITFDSVLEEQVYDALVERGYKVATQVGIGGYSIDLAVKKGGKYVLGIECDGKLYHSSSSARERDYHRQKYLESRGWKIHRIWSTNWWKNPAREIEKICAIVGEPDAPESEKPENKEDIISLPSRSENVVETSRSVQENGKKAEKQVVKPSAQTNKAEKRDNKRFAVGTEVFHTVLNKRGKVILVGSNSIRIKFDDGVTKGFEYPATVNRGLLIPVEKKESADAVQILYEQEKAPLPRKCENCSDYVRGICGGMGDPKTCVDYKQKVR